MVINQSNADCYTVEVTKGEPASSKIIFSVYDDGHDLVAFIEHNDKASAEEALAAFSSVTALNPSLSEAEVSSAYSDYTPLHLSDNPSRQVIEQAINSLLSHMQSKGFSVTKKRNDWQ